MNSRLAVTAALCGAALLARSFAVPSVRASQEKSAEKPQVVEMESFRVSPPPDGKWQIDTEESPRQVIFTKFRTGLLSSLAGQARSTVVSAAEIMLEPAVWRMTEEEAAEHILKGFITREAREWEAPGKVEDRGETVLKDKKLRFVMFRKKPIGDQGPGVNEDSAVFLYFPPKFTRSHLVYIFSSSFIRPRSGPIKLYKNPGLESVHAVIESLEILDPLRAVAGTEGDLLRAAAAGDVEAARLAIGQGASVNTRIPLWSALMAAAYHGHKDVVDLLLEQGADIDLTEDLMGATPLHSAVVAGEPELAAELVERGADVNIRTTDGSSALLFAAAQGFGGLVSKLLEKGAAVDAGTAHGETPFMFSADCGSIETAGILKAAGADVNAQTNSGETALMFAAGRGHADLVGWLLENGADPKHRSMDGRTPLWRAVESGDPALVKKLIEAGADVNAGTEEGFTALMLAAEYGQTECVGLLIGAGADVNARAVTKTTALRSAKYKKHADIVKMLKAAGAKK